MATGSVQIHSAGSTLPGGLSMNIPPFCCAVRGFSRTAPSNTAYAVERRGARKNPVEACQNRYISFDKIRQAPYMVYSDGPPSCARAVFLLYFPAGRLAIPE